MNYILVFGLIIILGLIYSRWIEPYLLHKKEVVLYSDKIKLKDDYIAILFLSDFHLHKKTDDLWLRALKKRLEKENKKNKFDLVLLGGDFIDHNEGIDKLPEMLNCLYSENGIYAVLGNHDYWQYNFKHILQTVYSPGDRKIADLKSIEKVFADINIKILINEKIDLKIKNINISLFGIDYLSKEPEQAGILKMWDDVNKEFCYNILLTHYPDPIFTVKNKVDLVVAGHTHGGQVTLFGHPIISRSGLKRKWVKGLSIHGDTKLYVTKGLGTSRYFPFRFFSRPEVTIIKLKGSDNEKNI